ncbi:hypothetical protein MNEG_4811 [Monoraphidium neglectum]|jgi:hypothetical protein|uniref:Senescence domain-containing protein n=1 Tax=Monoraphidium neglectum TaxID=145388 RepID=A0A0D2MRX5_9CHLO|nr:hypothetical protein MNEG_4811 [Monoraphidium neglectum]KIZ03147.1 hypothetical protein MNEG_4811 [Monoraphidium neglectum]|eukprot:XP_013902166.1 hypothetical protein MNEG_4811 [Monoraphidium neglectum]
MDEEIQLRQQQQRAANAARLPTADNALMWALEKVDRQLDQIEQDPPALLKASYDVANGPVGSATSKGVQAAAKVTLAATTQAVKAAAPIGSWALREGFKVASKAAVGLVSMAMEQQQQAEQRDSKKRSQRKR